MEFRNEVSWLINASSTNHNFHCQ